MVYLNTTTAKLQGAKSQYIVFLFRFLIVLISLPPMVPFTFRTVTKLIFDFSFTLQEICRDSQSESIVILTISMLHTFAVRLSHTTERILIMNATTTSSHFTLRARRTFTHSLPALRLILLFVMLAHKFHLETKRSSIQRISSPIGSRSRQRPLRLSFPVTSTSSRPTAPEPYALHTTMAPPPCD